MKFFATIGAGLIGGCVAGSIGFIVALKCSTKPDIGPLFDGYRAMQVTGLIGAIVFAIGAWCQYGKDQPQ